MSGESGCKFCSRRWSLLRALGVPMALVRFDGTRGHFALCGPCWTTATEEQRVITHMWSLDQRKDATNPDEREAIENAIRWGWVEFV